MIKLVRFVDWVERISGDPNKKCVPVCDLRLVDPYRFEQVWIFLPKSIQERTYCSSSVLLGSRAGGRATPRDDSLLPQPLCT